MAPLGEGVPTLQIFVVVWTRIFVKYVKNDIFCQKKFWGGVPPPLYHQNNHPQQFLIPTLPIHYDTFRELRWRLRGATRESANVKGQNLAEND